MIENIEKFKGVFVAFYACYDDEGNVSVEKIQKLAKWYVEKGVNGLYLTGSSGEGMMLTKEERMKTVSAVMEAVGGKTTVIAHVGAPSTHESCELAAQAAATGDRDALRRASCCSRCRCNVFRYQHLLPPAGKLYRRLLGCHD